MTDVPESPDPPPADELSSGDSLADQLSDTLPYLKAQSEAAASIIQEALRLAERGAEPFAAVFAEIGTQLEQARTLREIGWIPHPALPIQNFAGSETDLNVLSPIVRRYVHDNSETIYSVLATRFKEYDLEIHTANLCEDVIKAHRLQLFTLIVPPIFAEIEHCARDALESTGNTVGRDVIPHFTNKLFRLPTARFHFTQLETLMLMRDFMYKPTYKPLIAKDSIPHRHRSQHGIMRYRDSQTCLNAIFLLDFVLRSREVMKAISSDQG